ncbi:NADH:flavin oxidoreductase/NADH oxidase [Methylocella silvestris BL2]|uniref:NADH:flavin oxidoreductase/NADH oxidase n=1 Tax=Methylocella silvestris (strain DSM 15510 / CIP 108128 / LMG 27833 / NCIMB 13906 / BL2) TaxID=395965 RepID=B8EJ90_METSB|nr:alkene reductase [Methylocella silvestris]ACK52582.1 NADH:flavin oxidoreductase/NADH oxidase [Methylocella silvestris BL2]
MTADANVLFSPFTLGDLRLPNRIVMAPLTRSRATKGTLAPSDLNATYYRQRASAGMIISEASQISQEGQGYFATPGIYSEEQVEGWKKVTDAVHEEGGLIFIQLWHVGRYSHVSLQPGGGAPVAPSAIAAKGQTFIESGLAPVSAPRALALDEIPRVVADYRRAAENAKRAGFDGVEIHGANGYLIDQFLKDGTNKRDDSYGGSVENRTRFALEVTDAILAVWDKSRVGIRLSPVSPVNDAVDSAPEKVFFPLVAALSQRGLAYIHVIEGATGGARDNAPFDFPAFRKSFSGAYIANNAYTRDLAIEALEADRADLIAFGKLFISNPDLVERLRENAPLNAPHVETFYGGAAEGYTDYPALDDA